MYVNNQEIMKTNYYKKFITALSNEFGFTGIPIRILIRDRERKSIKKKEGHFKIRMKDTVKSVRMQAIKNQKYVDK